MNVENYKSISMSLFSFNEELKDNGQDKTTDIVSFWILIVFLLIFFLLSLYFFLNLLIHLLKNIKNPAYKFFIFWLDYIFISFCGCFFVISYIIFLVKVFFTIIQGKEIDRENTSIISTELSFEKFLMWCPSFTLMPMIFMIIDNLILDIIHFGILLKKMYKLYCIKDYDNIEEVYQKCKDENFNNIFNSKIHLSLVILIFLLDVFALCVFGNSMRIFKELNIEETITKIKDKEKNNILFIFDFELFMAVLKIIQVIVLILIIFFMISTTYFKKHILESNYYNDNILIQKIYNSSISKISFHKDFFTFKTILDFIMNIPALLYFALDQLSTIPIIISGFCLFIYIYFLGAMFLHIEKHYKLSNLSEKLIKIFFLNKLNFKFGERERKKQIEELHFEYNEFEEKVMNELSTSIIVSPEIIKKDKELNFLNTDVIITDRDNEEEENESIDLSKEENYFIIFKLIYIYFQQNQEIFEKIENEMKNSLFFINNQNVDKKNVNDQNYLIGIEKLSNLSKINQKELNQSYNIGGYNVFYSLEEKEYREQFKKNNKLDEKTYIKKSNKLFNIESYINEELFCLFPFYQITINDILDSINPIYNKSLFENFAKEKDKNENDKKENDNNSNFESNYFYSFNSHLSFEAYDENEQFNFKFLKNFISNYNNYLMNKLKNMNYTFLPLIIGIFKITSLKKNKIIILYRNPLLYSQKNKFQQCFNLFNNGSETIVQKDNKEFLNIEEIEKKNITLVKNDHNELINNLNKDIDFIKDYSIFPIINLFIGINEDTSLNDSMTEDENKINDKKDNINNDNDNDNLFYELNTNINIKKNDRTESNCLLEKEFNCVRKNNKFSIKIYFTNFFRNNNSNNDIDNNEENNLSNETYINLIKNEILKYIK